MDDFTAPNQPKIDDRKWGGIAIIPPHLRSSIFGDFARVKSFSLLFHRSLIPKTCSGAGFRQRGIAPHERGSCTLYSDEPGAIGSSERAPPPQAAGCAFKATDPHSRNPPQDGGPGAEPPSVMSRNLVATPWGVAGGAEPPPLQLVGNDQDFAQVKSFSLLFHRS